MTTQSLITPELEAGSSTADAILNYIRGAIADGSLNDGEPIRQDEVARRFNVSKIPVREALKRLEAEGFVAFIPNRGVVVRAVSDPEIAQIFETRAILESNAIGFSVPMMTAESLARASACCAAFDEAGDVAQWSALNWQFHSSLYLDAQRPYLVELIRTINVRLERYLRIQLTLSVGKGIANEEHHAILDACRAGDAGLASRLTYEHIMGANKSLHRFLPGARF